MSVSDLGGQRPQLGGPAAEAAKPAADSGGGRWSWTCHRQREPNRSRRAGCAGQLEKRMLDSGTGPATTSGSWR